MPAINLADNLAERSGAISSQRPEHPTSSDVRSDASTQGWKKNDNKQAKCSSTRPCGLQIYLSKGEVEGTLDYGVDVGDGI